MTFDTAISAPFMITVMLFLYTFCINKGIQFDKTQIRFIQWRCKKLSSFSYISSLSLQETLHQIVCMISVLVIASFHLIGFIYGFYWFVVNRADLFGLTGCSNLLFWWSTLFLSFVCYVYNFKVMVHLWKEVLFIVLLQRYEQKLCLACGYKRMGSDKCSNCKMAL